MKEDYYFELDDGRVIKIVKKSYNLKKLRKHIEKFGYKIIKEGYITQ